METNECNSEMLAAVAVSNLRPQQLIIADIVFKVQNQAFLHFMGTFL